MQTLANGRQQSHISVTVKIARPFERSLGVERKWILQWKASQDRRGGSCRVSVSHAGWFQNPFPNKVPPEDLAPTFPQDKKTQWN